MGLGNILVLSQATGYALSFLMSLCIVIPMSVHVDNFNGHCLLYTTGSFSSQSGLLLPQWSSPSYCGYTIFVGILLLVASVIQIMRMAFFLYYEMDSSFLSAFLDTVINIFLTGLIFLAAVIISGGFKTWCDVVTQRFASCEDASLTQLVDSTDGTNTLGFYIQLGTAQFGIWCSWVVWVLLTVLATRKLCRYHEQENIRVSMARERQRLMNAATGSSYTEIDA